MQQSPHQTAFPTRLVTTARSTSSTDLMVTDDVPMLIIDGVVVPSARYNVRHAIFIIADV
jgi:hypothetical protein